MTICDKINDVGETLQENLNNRGVDCTFGTGTGESTVLEMVEMVNGTNFKGSSDVNLKIGANRPYLLTGETTDVVVRLEDGLCEPLKNKNVTIEQSLFRDNGTTATHNDNWSNPQYMTRTDTGTTISNTGTGTVFNAVRRNNSNLGFANTNYVVEFEIVENPSSTNKFRFDGQTICTGESYAQYDLSFGQNETGKFKFVYDSTNNTIAKYKNGTYVATYNHQFCGNMGFLFRLESGASIKIKDFVVYEIINGVTDEKGEFALYDVSVTGDTTFTATYGTETATTNVYLCQFVDYGITSKHNDTWTLTSNMQRTRNDSYTTLSNIGSTSQMAYPINNTTKFSGDITIEWENYATTYQLNYLIIKGTSDMARTFGALGINKVCNVKITVVGTSVKSYIDGVQKDSYTINRDTNNQFEIRLQINPTGDNIKYNNFRIR